MRALLNYSLVLALLMQPLAGCQKKNAETTTEAKMVYADMAAAPEAESSEIEVSSDAEDLKEEVVSAGMGSVEATPKPEAPVPTADSVVRRMLDRDGTIDIQVRNYQTALDSVRMLVRSWGGYVESLNETNADYMRIRTAQFQLRVPSKGFEGAMNQLAGLGLYVNNRSETVTDVTREYHDNLARLKTRRILQERYQTLLRQAKSVRDIMQIERELNNIRYEVEAAESQKKATEFEVQMSQISLALNYEKERIAEPPSNSFWARLGRSLEDSVEYAGDMILAIIRALPSILIVAVLLGVPGWLLWRRWKRNKA